MNQPRRARRTMFVAAALAAGVTGVVTTGGAAAVPPHESFHGVFQETATGAGLGYDISGSAKMTVGDDSTAVKVNVAGLDPAKTYGSHLHDGTCATGGGGHYQDVEGGAVTPPNELWLSSSDNPMGPLVPNPGGVTHGAGSADWAARTDSPAPVTNALSVVVHEPGGARIACADLT